MTSEGDHAQDFRVAVEPTARNGLRTRSHVMADKPVTIRRARVGRKIGSPCRELAALPGAAVAFRATVRRGLAGDAAAVAEARLILRPMLGPITLEPDADGALWAS